MPNHDFLYFIQMEHVRNCTFLYFIGLEHFQNHVWLISNGIAFHWILKQHGIYPQARSWLSFWTYPRIVQGAISTSMPCILQVDMPDFWLVCIEDTGNDHGDAGDQVDNGHSLKLLAFLTKWQDFAHFCHLAKLIKFTGGSHFTLITAGESISIACPQFGQHGFSQHQCFLCWWFTSSWTSWRATDLVARLWAGWSEADHFAFDCVL